MIVEADHDYLLAGDVFTSDLIETWIELKRDDIDAMRCAVHPHEFELYYDVYRCVAPERASDQEERARRPG